MEGVTVTRFALLRPDDKFNDISVKVNPIMQTLDRKFSASSDQLDNIQRLRYSVRRPRARSASRMTETNKNDNKLQFCRSICDEVLQKNDRHQPRKSVEVFLEDDGPYSRKFYGSSSKQSEKQQQIRRERYLSLSHTPYKNKVEVIQKKDQKSSKNQRMTNSNKETKLKEEDYNVKCAMNGLLWERKDQLFSR